VVFLFDFDTLFKSSNDPVLLSSSLLFLFNYIFEITLLAWLLLVYYLELFWKKGFYKVDLEERLSKDCYLFLSTNYWSLSFCRKFLFLSSTILLVREKWF